MKEDRILKYLEEIDFLERYRKITEDFGDLSMRWAPKKDQVESPLNDSGFDFDYSAKEKMFFTSYVYGDYCVKFLISYKYGVLEGWFQLFAAGQIKMNNRFDFLGDKIKEGYRESLESSLPICSSEKDLNIIINEFVSIYRDLINAISKDSSCIKPTAS